MSEEKPTKENEPSSGEVRCNGLLDGLPRWAPKMIAHSDDIRALFDSAVMAGLTPMEFMDKLVWKLLEDIAKLRIAQEKRGSFSREDSVIRCPFCGFAFTRVWQHISGAHWVQCDRCEAQGPIAYDDEEAHILWSTRAV